MVELENRLFELLDQIRLNEIKRSEKAKREGKPGKETEYHLHGLCAVLGYEPQEHSSYISKIRASKKDLFQNRNVHLYDQEALRALEEGMEDDGAILIDREGKFLHSGKYIKWTEETYDQNPQALATYLNLQEREDAGTRHLAAIAFSAERPDLLIYTLKSDYPVLHVFNGGLIYRSAVASEGLYKAPKKQLEI